MKTAHVIRDMQKSHKDGVQLFHQGNYEGAVDCYRKCLKLCCLLSADEVFDRQRFEASCYARLSASLGRLGKHLESLAAANKALLFYDECGEKYPEDTGKWLMALVNQGTSLATLGCFAAAMDALMRAKEIFNKNGMGTNENKNWIETVEGNIAAINAHLAKQKP